MIYDPLQQNHSHPRGAARSQRPLRDDDPKANPLKADYKGFPRLYVNTGAVETLLDNAQDLAHIAKVDGVDVTLSVVDGMQHVFPFLAGRAAAADEELRQGRLSAWRKRRPVRTEP
jgi:epsilon-lactone hydrolase